MELTHKFCPACSSKNIHPILESKNFPSILFPIEEENRQKVSTSPLMAKGCGDCNHIFLTSINLEFNRNIYSDYYYLYPFSNLDSLMHYYRLPFENIFKIFANPKEKKLLEIGCSEPSQLDFFKEQGYSCIAISPGSNSNSGTEMINGYYEDIEFEKVFDCIVSRFNLEHIINLEDFLKKVYSDLIDGGLFFAQVPNIASFLYGGMVNIFEHEHPQYFCKSSLYAAITRANFQVEFIKGDDLDPSIILVARKIKTPDNLIKKLSSNLKNIESIIAVLNQSKDDTHFVFYGAGLSLAGLLYLDGRILQFLPRVTLVDDNQILWGKFMPNSDLKVLPLDPKYSYKKSILFLLLNHVYHDQVIKRIKNIPFKEIYSLDDHGFNKIQ